MKIELSSSQSEKKQIFQTFVNNEIAPYADQFDKNEKIPKEVIQKIIGRDYAGMILPDESDNHDFDMISYGLLCEEIGKASASLLSIVTVHGMVCQSLLKWGTTYQKEYWLPKLANGETIGAFALTEPNIGSDAKNVGTTAVFSNGSYTLTGRKKWISCAQLADIFLIMAQCEGKPVTFLIEKDQPGLSILPIHGMMGFKSAMLAELQMDKCIVSEENIVGRLGFGFSHVGLTALNHGRYCIAWGGVGIAQGCLDASLDYTAKRKQFGAYLKDHQLIKRMIADMVTNIKAARLLCYHAGYLNETADPDLIMETSIAKYFASRTAVKAANDAVQIHGANGCSSHFPVERYMRDAKILEIIEGSNEIQQLIIADYAY
jgi:hypothetical protein